MPKIFLRNTEAGLVPIDDEGLEVLSRFARDEVIRVEPKKARNSQHHRLFFKLVKTVWENQEVYPDPESMRAAIQAAVGHAEVVQMKNGNSLYVPKSIAFDKMDQLEFDRFYNKVCDLVCTKIIPGLDKEDLKREVGKMVGAEPRRAESNIR